LTNIARDLWPGAEFLRQSAIGGRAAPSDPTVRVKIVGRYHYKIFYSVGADEIEIYMCATALVVRGFWRVDSRD
jgi:hypothetical protein